MPKTGIIYLCSAVDERTLARRRITSDSPAGTQKVLQISKALRSAGLPVTILSLGRGRQNGTGAWHPAEAHRIDGLPVLYAPFFHFPVLTHLVSLLGLVPLVWRLRRRGLRAMLVYNRLAHYLLGLTLGRVLGFRCFLDLEDGDIRTEIPAVRRLWRYVMRAMFDHLCSHGALLASRALTNQYGGHRAVPCYGVATPPDAIKDWGGDVLRVLLGGTLQRSTGADLFIQAVEYLRSVNDPHLSNLEFLVTGRGDSVPEIRRLSAREGVPRVTWLGMLSRREYLDTLARAHAGLALKLPSSEISDTTFPSKVIELASHGLCLVTTPVSDVPFLFEEDGALYVTREDPSSLAEQLVWMLRNRPQVIETARRGRALIETKCSQEVVGESLRAFFSVP